MSDNIGTITVAIEAQTQALEESLMRAEQVLVQSAKRMEAQQQGLGNMFKASWVEIASKITVATTALSVAEGAVKGLSGAMDVFGEEGTSSAEKVGGAIMAFGNAGIPIVSQLIGVAEGLAEVFVRSGEQIAEVTRMMEEHQAGVRRTESRQRQEAMADDLSAFVDNMAARVDIEKSEGDKAQQLHIARAQERFNLERDIQKRIKTLTGEEGMDADSVRQMQDAKDRALELHDEETRLLQQRLADEIQKENANNEEKLRLARQLAQEKAQAEADATKDLQTQLAIMQAKASGDEEKARTLAINARYEAMKKGATDAQKAIIEAMQAIELEGMGGSSAAPAAKSTSRGTSSVSTALGSMTIAKQGMEQKKQTSILERIAKSSATVASEITKKDSSGIIVAS
tara:strand:- start:9520 stop:10719 length:1200 start_codon:yes stop_codon:yes gene_type:complete